MRYLYLFFALVFVLFAVVQYNDPDPIVWMSIYGYGGLVSIMAFTGRFNKWMIIAGMIFYLAGAVYLFPPSVTDWISAEQESKSLQMKMPFVEEARESLGLLISFAILLVYFIRSRAYAGKNRSVQHSV